MRRPEHLPAPREPTGHRALRPTKHEHGLLDGLALQITQQDGKPVRLRKMIQLSIEYGLHFAPQDVLEGVAFIQDRRLLLPHLPLDIGRLDFERRAEGNAIYCDSEKECPSLPSAPPGLKGKYRCCPLFQGLAPLAID
jgi:hypothetical protein